MAKQSIFSTTVIMLLIVSGCVRASEITLLTWPEYISQSLLDNFYHQTGTRVKQIHYDSDDARDRLLNLTQGQGYDIILTSRVRLPVYQEQQWLSDYDNAQLTNLIHIDAKWQLAAKEFGDYCVPYFWGTIGIVYNKKYVTHPPASWRDFFAQAKDYSGKVNLLNDSRTLLPMALIAAGFDSHSDDHAQINQAASLIYQQLPHINSFSALSLDETNRLNDGEIWISMAYNGDALYLKSLNADLEFIQPSDGTNAWLDCLTISKASGQKELAHQFINFLLNPQNAKHLALDLQYPTPNLTAYKLLPEEIQNDHTLYPKLSNKIQLNKVLAASTEGYFQMTYKQLVFAHKQLGQGKK